MASICHWLLNHVRFVSSPITVAAVRRPNPVTGVVPVEPAGTRDVRTAGAAGGGRISFLLFLLFLKRSKTTLYHLDLKSANLTAHFITNEVNLEYVYLNTCCAKVTTWFPGTPWLPPEPVLFFCSRASMLGVVVTENMFNLITKNSKNHVFRPRAKSGKTT